MRERDRENPMFGRRLIQSGICRIMRVCLCVCVCVPVRGIERPVFKNTRFSADASANALPMRTHT